MSNYSFKQIQAQNRCNSHKLNNKRRVRSGFCFCFCRGKWSFKTLNCFCGTNDEIKRRKSSSLHSPLSESEQRQEERGRLTESFMFVAERTMMNLIALYYQTQTRTHPSGSLQHTRTTNTHKHRNPPPAFLSDSV